MTELAGLVERSRAAATRREFDERVDVQTARLVRDIEAGAFESDGFALGLELEVYAVDGDGRLVPVPEGAFAACNKELGLHNAELNTDPDPFTTEGIRDQARAIRDRVAAAREALADADPAAEFVLDSMWTIPPAEGSREYLGATHEADGVTVPSNMRLDPRYCAIDRDCVERFGGRIPFSVPGFEGSFPSILFESLATSIQPHVQIPSTERFPAYYNAAIRTLGPVLALTANSPFLPADCYEGVDPGWLFEHTHHELRIAAFEGAVNCTEPPKCRVPADIDAASDLPERVRADPVLAPFLSEWLGEGGERPDPETFADTIPEFDHKRGTYWRWLRAVIGGQPVPGYSDERSLRIEYRPVPTQPTVTDTVAVQVLVAGLLRGLVATDHPLSALSWERARESFYAAAEDGLDADLAWLTADGERVSDLDRLYDDLFACARAGLAEQGIDAELAERYLSPLEARVEARATPSSWKLAEARAAVADGASLRAAIEHAQRRYVAHASEHDSFAGWL